MLKNKFIYILFLSIALNFVLHYKILNLDIQGVHTWRQSQTMWNIRNFYRHDANILNPRVSHFNSGKDNIYRYEFPLMQWFIAMVEKIFGENIFVVRIVLFLIGVFTVVFFYLLFKTLGVSNYAALGATILFEFSPVFYYYIVNPIPDNLALMSGIAYLYFIFKYIENTSTRDLIFASLFLAISTLSKLPYLMFSIVSIVYFVKKLFDSNADNRSLIRFFLVQFVFLIPAFLWYIWVMPGWTGNPVLKGIFDGSISFSRIMYIIRYHAGTTFPLILLNPASLLFFVLGIVKFKKLNKFALYGTYIKSLIIITFLYLILEFNAIGTIHDYYMMPFLPWLYIIVATGMDYLLQKNISYLKYISIFLLFLSPAIAYFIDKDKWSLKKTNFNPDVFIYKEKLKKAVPQNEQCIILNDISNYIFSYQIDKMGYIFSKDNLPVNWIDDSIKRLHIKYMYSDSRKVDTSAAFQPYIDSLLLQAGSVKVFKLKLPKKFK